MNSNNGRTALFVGLTGPRGEKGATGAKIVKTELVGQDENGGNIYRQTFDDGSTAEFTAPAGGTESLKFNYSDYDVPVIKFTGDISLMNKDNAVTLNYVYGDRTGTCTLKWQGSSSLAYPKKNYTVKFDNAFEAKEGWGEQNKYCLKADWIDFSHCRNVCSAKFWGEFVKSRTDAIANLLTLPNGGAIDGFPCFVVINDEWKGIYNFDIPKDGWLMGMGSGTKEAILCAEGNNNKFRAEATVSEQDGAHFGIEYRSDDFTVEEIGTSLNRLINACINSDGSDIDTTIAQYLDINSAIDYYIFSVVLFNLDGISKNYLLGTYDGVKWFFSAYDLDSTWGLNWDGKSFKKSGYSYSNELGGFWNLTYNDNKHRVFELLYKFKKPEIIARYKELRKNIISTANVSNIVREYAKQIPFSAYNAENVMWRGIPSSGANRPNQICEWVADRLKSVDNEIEQMNSYVEEQPTYGLAYSQKSVTWYESSCNGIGSSSDTDIVIASYSMQKPANIYIDGCPVVKITTDAFASNTTIKSVKIPNTVKKIESRAFLDCSALVDIELPDSIEETGISILNNVKLPTLKIPKNLTVINQYFNCNNNALTVLDIPNKVVEIGRSAFANSNNITKLRLSNNLKTIGQDALSRFLSLSSPVVFPKSLKTIDKQACNQWWRCPKLVFKGTPDSIGENALLEFGQNVKDENGNCIAEIYVPWAEGAVEGAPWGATAATIHYNADVDNIN